MSRNIVLTGSILILISIILGAMAAHSLEKVISAELLETFEKGVKYQLYTGIALLTVGLNADRFTFKVRTFLILNLIGVILFSGGIYVYSFHEITPALKPFVHVVPFGGSSMIIAWAIFIVQVFRQKA